MKLRSFCFLFSLVYMSACGGLPLLAAPTEATLAAGGRASREVVVSNAASPRVQAAAETLADYLGRMSGGEFDVVAGSGESGIAIGLVGDFPEIPLEVNFDTEDPQRREDYLLRTHAGGVYLIGATDLAVENATWDLLYRLGYRQFFPGKNWEIIPQKPDLKLAADVFEKPDHSYRRVWYGSGTWRENVISTEAWRSRNRMKTAFNVNTTHTYGSIIKAFPEEFAQHPEYLCHVDGKPTNKLNVSNPGLRALVVRWALEKLEKSPHIEVIPLDPSDGGGWGQSEEEKALGPISNRVVMLANEVAHAINERYGAEYGRKYVGIYAYNEHATPPTIPVSPNVMVLVATAFNKSGLSLDQLVAGWQKQGATIGMREYYNVITGSQDLPGRAPGSHIKRIAENIPKYHKLGARFLSAEGGDGWGACGLGYYLASRISWDVDEAEQLPALVDDFLEKSFGTAKAPMKRFYDLILPPTFLSASDLGKMYRSLDEARRSTKDPGVLARINDLLIYTRYVDIRIQFNGMSRQRPKPSVEEKRDAFAEMIKFLYRARHSHMVHLQGLWRDMPRRDKDLRFELLPEGAKFNTPEGQNPWKSADPITQKELDAWLEDGIARNEVVEFEPVTFSSDLVPATELDLKDSPRLETSSFIRNNIFYTWVNKANEPIRFTATVNTKGNPRTGRILLQKVNSASDANPSWQGGLAGYVDDEAGDAEATVEQASVQAEAIAEIKPTGEPQELALVPKETGLYRVILESRTKYGLRLDWDENMPLVHETTPDNQVNIHHRAVRYFYVPKGTSHVAGYIQHGGVIMDAAGNRVFLAPSPGAHFSIPVENGMDGRLWTLQGAYMTPALLTVPPYLARSAGELLLPREVVEADRPRTRLKK